MCKNVVHGPGSFAQFPEQGKVDPVACGCIFFLQLFVNLCRPKDKVAIDKMSPGDAVIVFTPDSKFKCSVLILSINNIDLGRHSSPHLDVCH